jgi:DNA-binding NtrC family response regulator
MKVPKGDPGTASAAQRIRSLSVETWGPDRAVELVGVAPSFVELLTKLEKVAGFDEPVLITGESGSGKEGLAQAIYLLGKRRGRPMVSVNCPQYLEGNLTVSELFGHKKGSFTGATSDRKGCFETANGGVIFLDEIGDLHMSAQVMLLRALATGEFQPLGSETTRRVDVRVVAATNRPLGQRVGSAQFRQDLYFRLGYFLLTVPPLRERGDDWQLLADHMLSRLQTRYGVSKRFSPEALEMLARYPWPGNVRELMSVTTMGYALADGNVIEPRDLVAHFEADGKAEDDSSDHMYRRVAMEGGTFWETVYTPFMERELNRAQVRAVLKRALTQAEGSYRKALDVLRIAQSDYQRLMDFLRHHNLKP